MCFALRIVVWYDDLGGLTVRSNPALERIDGLQ